MLDDPTLAATGGSGSIPHGEGGVLLRRGDSLDRFVVIDELGRGAMGTVYAAFDTKLERQVAVKLLHAPDRGIQSLLAEAQALARINHPNVVTVHDVGEHQGRLFLAMELVRGSTLRQWQRDSDRTWREIIEIYRMAARGLEAVHDADLVHGDFKPDNVMVADDGRVLVMDFGIARSLQSTVSGDSFLPSSSGSRSIELSRIRGTPAYMAPEQFALDSVGPLSDQFAFCIALYEALWGERPFEGNTLAELSRSVAAGQRRPRPTNRTVPRWIPALIDRGLSTNALDRHASMRALDDAFDQPQQRRRWLWAAGASSASLAAVVGLWPTSQATCDTERERLEALWNTSRASEVRKAFIESGNPRADHTWASSRQVLDGFAAAWVEASDALCSPAGLATPEPVRIDLRDCLSTQRIQLRAALRELEEPTSATVSRARELSMTLPQPSSCSEADMGSGTLTPAARAQLLAAHEQLANARAAWAVGDLPAAIDAINLAIGQGAPAERPRTAANLYAERSKYLASKGDSVASTADLTRGLELAGRAKDPHLTAELWTTYVAGAIANGDLSRARHVLLAAEVALEQAGRPVDLEVPFRRAQAMLAWKEGRHPQALVLIDEAIEFSDSTPLEPLMVGMLFNVRAMILISESRYAEADAALSAAIAVSTEHYGIDHPRTMLWVFNRGVLQLEWGKKQDARAIWVGLLKTLDENGDVGTRKAQTTTALAELALDLGDPQRAHDLIQEALKIWDQLDDGGRGKLTALRVQTKVLSALSRHEEAIEMGRAAISHAAATRSADDPYAVDTHRVLAEAYKTSGDAARALEELRVVRAFREGHYGPDNPKTVSILRMEASVLVEVDPAGALELANRVQKSLAEHPGSSTPSEYVDTALTRVRSLAKLGREDEARTIATAALAKHSSRRADAAREYEQLSSWAEKNGVTAPPAPLASSG